MHYAAISIRRIRSCCSALLSAPMVNASKIPNDNAYFTEELVMAIAVADNFKTFHTRRAALLELNRLESQSL
jgi:hypothetical protein